MPEIKVLPKYIAEKIAAGEVVERPASVIKELVENAIDAGSTKIAVEIEHGGIMFMRVTDNGCGIDRQGIKTAFLRHATSKISAENDLNNIATLGFRGEALAAICAVSRVEMLSAQAECEGTRYVIEGGEEKLICPVGCPTGTTIIVRDLFYNTPARMRFLKKDVSEANAVSAVMDRIALSHPEIAISLIRDGKRTLSTAGDGKLKTAIYSVLGKDYANSLIPAENTLGLIKIGGYICKPIYCKSSRGGQFFFINGRLVKSGTAAAAVEQAYRNSIMTGKFPSCVLCISVPYDSVDVNVHPSKTEVRFADEKSIFDCIYYGVKSALEKGDTRPELSLPQKNKYIPEIPVKEYRQTTLETPVKNTPKPKSSSSERRVSTSLSDINIYRSVLENAANAIPAGVGVLKDDNVTVFDTVPEKKLLKETKISAKETHNSNIVPETKNDDVDNIKYIGEAFDTYIIVQKDSSLFIIDKHAAHERILFNRLKKRDIPQQMLLTASAFNLPADELSAVSENIDMLKGAGFEIEDFGNGSIVVRSVPSPVIGCDIPSLISEIAQGFLTREKTADDILDRIFHMVACKAAIKGGSKGSEKELLFLAKQVLFDKDVMYCPHGRPVAFELTDNYLKKQFGRIV